MIEKMDGMTTDLVAENIEKLKQLFPTIVREDKIDFEELELLLGENINRNNEQYSFVWNGKTQATKLAQKRSTGTLRPCIEESKNWDKTKNIYIEGDNLEVLKLLQSSYNGRIKMIYIDPPYNTGHDFVYKDNFEDNIVNYKEVTGQSQKSNADTDGRFHTNWLNMMYPRLKLARNLLTDNGVIFISIDDNEYNNLKKICDEIFGEYNFVGSMSLLSNPRGSQNSKHLSYVHEYILMYAKHIDELEIKGVGKDESIISEFSEIDASGRKYRLLGLRKRGGAWKKEDRPLLHYPIYVNPQNGEVSLERDSIHIVEVVPQRPTGELGRWCWGKTKFLAEKFDLIGKKVNRKGEKECWDIFRKDYLLDEDGNSKTSKVKTIWVEKETNYQNAKNEIRELFGDSEVFDFPKPIYIIKKLISMMFFEDEDIILDFFSGSSSTAHAVFSLNVEDSGNRRFIMVQLPQVCAEHTVAYKLGYNNICEIAKERIDKAGEIISQEYNLDIGFKVFKLDSSNLKKWNNAPTKSAEDVINRIQTTMDYIEEGRTELDLVYEIMLKYGIDLTLPITKSSNNKAYIVNGDDYKLLICSETNLTLDDIESFANESVGTYLFADRCFLDDNLLINAQEILKSRNKEIRLF